MVRGTGKFKQKRGGGRNFSKDMVLDENGTAVSAARQRAENASDDDSDEEEEEEEEESEDEPVAGGADKPELSRTERRELKKKQAAEKAKAKAGDDEDEDEDLINPNHVQKKMNISDLGSRELSRKDREAKEKKDAQDKYWKLHLQGKTEQAKTDLARLAKIKADREAAQAKRKAENDAKAAEVEAKKKAQQGRR